MLCCLKYIKRLLKIFFVFLGTQTIIGQNTINLESKNYHLNQTVAFNSINDETPNLSRNIHVNQRFEKSHLFSNPQELKFTLEKIGHEIRFKKREGHILHSKTKKVLNQVARLLRANNDRQITIQIHSYNKPNLEFSKFLSQRRAAGIYAYLIHSKGLSKDQIHVIGVGASSTKYSTTNAIENRKNNRIEFIVK